MIPIGYALAVSACTLIFGVTIHFIYKKLHRKKVYEGITVIESLLILIGSVPGLGGCASGWLGIGIPLPLIVGAPLHIVLLGSSSCGWSQALIFDDAYLTQKFISFPIAWGLTSLFIIVLLYMIKIFRNNKTNKVS